VPASACSLDLHSPRGTRLCRRQRGAPLDDRWARIRRCRASPSHISPESWNRLCAFVPNIADHLDREFWFKTPDTQTIHRAPVPLYLEQPRCVFVCQKKNVMLDTGKDAENLFMKTRCTRRWERRRAHCKGQLKTRCLLLKHTSKPSSSKLRRNRSRWAETKIRTVLSIGLYRPNLIVSLTKSIHSMATAFRRTRRSKPRPRSVSP